MVSLFHAFDPVAASDRALDTNKSRDQVIDARGVIEKNSAMLLALGGVWQWTDRNNQTEKVPIKSRNLIPMYLQHNQTFDKQIKKSYLRSFYTLSSVEREGVTFTRIYL